MDDIAAIYAPTTAATNEDNLDFIKLNSLFVSDSLHTCANRKYEVKYKYNAYGGSYKQLPGYSENKLAKTDLAEVLYEIDLEGAKSRGNKNNVRPDGPAVGEVSSLRKVNEKHGWLSYKSIVNNVSEKALKRRYFHLRRVDSPISSRNHTVEARYRKLNSEIRETNSIYLLEYFKEVPGIKRHETPKNHIMFDSNITFIKNVRAFFIFIMA